MGLIEMLRKKSAVSATIGGSCLLLAFVVFYVTHANSYTFTPLKSVYFSDDDGKTFFSDDAMKVAPFERNGKVAVSAHVYKCNDGTMIVGYLEKAASDEAKKLIEQTQADMNSEGEKSPTSVPDAEQRRLLSQSTVVKKPGDADWVAASSPKATRIYDVKCADGSMPTLTMP